MKLGILVSGLGASQLSFQVITQANTLLHAGVDHDVVVYYEDVDRPCVVPNFATMHAAEAWSFSGNMVATTLSTANKMLRFPGVAERLFYVEDIEWLRARQSFATLRSIYGNPRLRLVARSEDHAQVLRNAFNRHVAVIEHFDLTGLMDLIA